MGYCLQALIAKRETLEEHASVFQRARVVTLMQNIAMIPLTDDLYDEIGMGGEADGFYKLSPGVESWAQRFSASGLVGYIEAEFFGGVGDQGAIAWSRGSRVFGPVKAQDAINQCLRLLGVHTRDAHDEFDAVGLGQHRDTNDWILQKT